MTFYGKTEVALCSPESQMDSPGIESRYLQEEAGDWMLEACLVLL